MNPPGRKYLARCQCCRRMDCTLGVLTLFHITLRCPLPNRTDPGDEWTGHRPPATPNKRAKNERVVMPVVKIAVACSEYLIKRDFGADFLVVQTYSQENGARSTAHSESDRAAVSVKIGPTTFRHIEGGKNGLIKKKNTHTHCVILDAISYQNRQTRWLERFSVHCRRVKKNILPSIFGLSCEKVLPLPMVFCNIFKLCCWTV